MEVGLVCNVEARWVTGSVLLARCGKRRWITLRNGLSPPSAGVNRTVTHWPLPGTAPALRRGMRPAETREDLPEPEAPITATTRGDGFVKRFTSSSVSLPRP